VSDIYSSARRSQIMSMISGKDTKPEIAVRKFLFSRGFRYRKNYKKLSGSPDIVLPKYRTAIFINGCFWHGHSNCKAAKLPASNIEFWTRKINVNIMRDIKNINTLKRLGWKVIVIWQCQITTREKLNKTIKKLVSTLLKTKR
jgi:DNA mismatch endonuclease (patch repair protein)